MDMYIYEYLHILYNKYEAGEDDKCLNWREESGEQEEDEKKIIELIEKDKLK
jgi:hypothetical protein